MRWKARGCSNATLVMTRLALSTSFWTPIMWWRNSPDRQTRRPTTSVSLPDDSPLRNGVTPAWTRAAARATMGT